MNVYLYVHPRRSLLHHHNDWAKMTSLNSFSLIHFISDFSGPANDQGCHVNASI